ncbi:MAG: molybdopterin molybdotransferase MoeA [Fusobacteriaceae bacterium]
MQLLTLDTALEILLNNTKGKVETLECNLSLATGKILAEDIFAPMDNPPFNRSPLDGFCFHHLSSQGASFDSPKPLEIIGEIDAGINYLKSISFNQCIRVMTGGMLPQGSNCVIRQEDAMEENGYIFIKQELKEFENFCFQGEDIKKGTLLMKKDSKLTHHHIGVLATMGIEQVKIIKPILVGILNTGDELSELGVPLSPGKIYNSNLYFLTSRLNELGVNFKILKKSPDITQEVVSNILDNIDSLDLLITTGGVSVGRKDIMHEVINVLKCDKLFWKVKIQPGTPVLCSKLSNKIIMSLSGNPFACLANLELLVRPVIAKLSRDKTINSTKKNVVLQGSFNKNSKNRRFLRAYYENDIVYLNSDGHSSGEVFSSLNTNCFIDIPQETEKLSSGEFVDIIIL